MKGIITMALAAAVALGANAGGRSQQAVEKLNLGNRNFRSEVTMQKKHAAPARVRALQNYEGEYEWERYDEMDYRSYITSTVEFTLVDASTGEFSINFGYGYNVKCYIDPETNILTIPAPQETGLDFFGEEAGFYLHASMWDQGNTGDDAAIGYINGKVISFPSSDIWVMGNWPDCWMYTYQTSDNTFTFQGEIIEDGGGDPIEGVEEIAGTYEFSYYGLLNGNSGSKLTNVEITVTNPATGEVAISGIDPSSNGFIVKGFYSPSDQTLSLPNKQYLGLDDWDDPNYFYIKTVDEEGYLVDGAVPVEASVGIIQGNIITFPTYDIWAIGDFNNEGAGWWFLAYSNIFTGDNTVDPNEGWEDFCDATFEDGWITPSYYLTDTGAFIIPDQLPWTVKVQRNIEDPNLLRLDNPYLADDCPLSPSAFEEGGYIEFSIADPTYVVVTPNIFCGAVISGATKLFALNHAGFYGSLGYTKEEIEAGLEGFIPSTYDAATQVISIPNCGFNFAGATDGYYTWQDGNNQSLAGNMNAKITLLNVVGVDAPVAAKSEVIYYNLQGQRVQNPEGGIFIRVEGNKTTKVIK